MAKTLEEAKLGGRSDRRRLEPRSQPYWRSIDPEVHLGYRRKLRGGVWLVRWRVGKGYQQAALGAADDELAEGTLDFDQAVRAARELVTRRRQAVCVADGSMEITVAEVTEAYIRMRDQRDEELNGKAAKRDARSRLELYVIGREGVGGRRAISPKPIAAVRMAALTEDDLTAWRDGLPAALAASTVKRLVNDFRAALSEGYAEHRRRLPPELPGIIKHGLRERSSGGSKGASNARENQVLSRGEVERIIRAASAVDARGKWDGDLYRLVIALAATGARLSQLLKMKVSDVRATDERLVVPMSQKGRGKGSATINVRVGVDVIEVLRPACEGRVGGAVLFERWRHRQVGGVGKWERERRVAWGPADLTRPWAMIRDEADLPGIIPYALRHTSIVRQIEANLPIRLVAARHDTSVAMIEQHYGRYIVDGLDDLTARAITRLVPSP